MNGNYSNKYIYQVWETMAESIMVEVVLLQQITYQPLTYVAISLGQCKMIFPYSLKK